MTFIKYAFLSFQCCLYNAIMTRFSSQKTILTSMGLNRLEDITSVILYYSIVNKFNEKTKTNNEVFNVLILCDFPTIIFSHSLNAHLFLPKV